MKKVLNLLSILLLAFSVSSPAMAETTTTAETATSTPAVDPTPAKTANASCLANANAKNKAQIAAAKTARAKALAKAKKNKTLINAANRKYNNAVAAAKKTLAARQRLCTAVVKTGKFVTVDLYSQNNSGEAGSAILYEQFGKVTVELNLAGAPTNIYQPAHLHLGSCGDLGATQFGLKFPYNGKSTTILDVSLAKLRSMLPLAINVHKSGAEAEVFVACGDVKL